MKNREIFNLYEGLEEIGADKDLKFNIKTSYLFAKTKNILTPYYKAIIETREKLLYKYGAPTDDGWHVTKEQVDAFSREWQEFLDIENFITLETVSLNELQDVQIGINLMQKLLPIINN